MKEGWQRTDGGVCHWHGGAGEKWVPPSPFALLWETPSRSKELLGASRRYKLPSLFGGPAVPSTYEMQSKCLGQMDEYLGGCRGPFWLGNSQRGSQMLVVPFSAASHQEAAKSQEPCPRLGGYQGPKIAMPGAPWVWP